MGWFNQIQDVLRLFSAAWSQSEAPKGLPETLPSHVQLLENSIALLKCLTAQVHNFRLEKIDARLVPVPDSPLVSKEDLQVLDKRLQLEKKFQYRRPFSAR